MMEFQRVVSFRHKFAWNWIMLVYSNCRIDDGSVDLNFQRAGLGSLKQWRPLQFKQDHCVVGRAGLEEIGSGKNSVTWGPARGQ